MITERIGGQNMNFAPAKLEPPIRDEYTNSTLPPVETGDVEVPLSFVYRLLANTIVRRFLVLVGIAIVWQAYATWVDNPLIFPKFSDVMEALWVGVSTGEIPARLITTLKTLGIGYAIGILAATVFTILAVTTRIGTDILSTLTAMFNPMPAIALLPLALLWFGLGTGSLVFVIVHSVLWAVALNTHSGFLCVSQTQRMVGQTFGLKGASLIVRILIPAAFPSILAGLKIGWAFAWRTLIAAELVFGVASGTGGLGWFIYEKRNSLETVGVFAGLVTVMIVGLFVEGVVFRQIEKRTVIRWGQVQS